MKTESSRSADDGNLKASAEALLKPMFPSRIPKKPKKTSGRTNPLKRPFAATLGTKEVIRSALPTVAPASPTAALPPERKLSTETSELINLIPTLSGLDISRLVTSIKRRRLQRTKGVPARTPQRSTVTAMPPVPTKAAVVSLPESTKAEVSRGMDEKALQLELTRLRLAMENHPIQKPDDEPLSAHASLRADEATTDDGSNLSPPCLAEALSHHATR